MNFRNKYWFLSNMYPCEIKVNGMTFHSAEACFQSFKTRDPELRKQFMDLSGFDARKLGSEIELREDWNNIRVDVMRAVVSAKFRQHPELMQKLKTIPGYICEENTWNDIFWGVSKGIGKNHLGYILMDIRNK